MLANQQCDCLHLENGFLTTIKDLCFSIHFQPLSITAEAILHLYPAWFFLQVTGNHPDIIHVHEWQISGLPILYWDMYHNLSLKVYFYLFLFIKRFVSQMRRLSQYWFEILPLLSRPGRNYQLV